jgi:patatin-like phospholipase/acyl hydrolase
LLIPDSGGIRGIVELEVLRAIQKVVGDGIPIRAFFDLIVGTR